MARRTGQALSRSMIEKPMSAPGRVTAIDTHWIWQDGKCLAWEPFRVKSGSTDRLHKPGPGVRDGAIAMQYLIPGWKFNSKSPCMAG